MQLKVKDIEKLWNNGSASLVAGRGGLDRLVDVYDMMEQPDIKPWLRARLLVITTGYAIRNDKEAVLNLIRDLNEANASALAIKTRFFDEFPREALELADELDFPLFFLNNNSGSAELVFPVMVALVEAKNQLKLDTRYQLGRQNKSTLDEKLFWELQTGKITQEEEADYRATSLSWPSPPVCLLFIQLNEQQKQSALLEMDREKQLKAVNAIWEKHGIQCVVICRRKQCICIVKNSIEAALLEKTAEEIVTKTEKIQACGAHVLLTETLTDYLKLPELCSIVEECTYIRNLNEEEEKLLYMRDFLYERIILHTAQREETKTFVREKLGRLERYDREHDGHLMETLEMLIHKNGSRKLTAEALYLHRNTMAHRIEKIEEVLNTDLNDVEELKQLRFACQLKKYI